MWSAIAGKRLGNFDTLRLAFAVLVILSHSFALGTGSSEREPLIRLTHGQLTLGNISVMAFFAISGYLIAQSWVRDPTPGGFLGRRVARIYPGFIVAAVVSALMVVPFGVIPGTHRPINFAGFLLETLSLRPFACPPVFMRNVWPNAFNGSLWSIRIEFWCYIGLMLLGMMQVLRRRWIMATVMAAAIGWHVYLSIDRAMPGEEILQSAFGSLIDWANVLPCFLAGAVFQAFGGAKLIRRDFVFAAGVLVVISNFLPFGYVVSLPICGTYLLMALAFFEPLRPLNLGRFGDFSYGTYLYAYPLQQLIVQFSGGSMSPMKLFFLAAPAAVAAGAISWYLVERRFLARSAVAKHKGAQPSAKRLQPSQLGSE